MTTNSSAAGNLHQARMGPNFNNKTPKTHDFDAQMFLNCLEKNKICYTMANMPPSQLFWDNSVAGIKFKTSSFCTYHFKISQFKHLLCYLCSIVNKILAYVIWNYFSFILFKFKKTSQHFWNSGCTVTMNLDILLFMHTVFSILYSRAVFDFRCSDTLH